MSKISLNPKYIDNSGNGWSTTTYNSLEYHISTNKASSSVSTLKCEFTTPYDNIDVVVEIGSSSEANYDWCYVGKLDDSIPTYSGGYLNRTSGSADTSGSPTFKTVTINVAKAGTHFLIIGYRKDGSGDKYNDCGYFRLVTTEVDSLEPTKYIYCGKNDIGEKLIPESILANNKDIDEVYVGSDLIWNKKKYIWCSLPGYDISLGKTFYHDDAKIPISSYTKYNNNKTILKGATDSNTYTYYGYDVTGELKNGYLCYGVSAKAVDLSMLPNPVKYANVESIMFLKINPNLNKEITNLEYAFSRINLSNTNKIYEPLIAYHEVCNVIGLDKLNTSNITNMSNMFGQSRVVGNLDLSNLDTSNVTYTYSMFSETTGHIEGLYSSQNLVQNYSYLTGLNNWDVSNVTNMNSMFKKCTYYIFKDEELNWDTRNVANMSWMFSGVVSYSFPKLIFDTSNVTNMSYMFQYIVTYNGLDINFSDTSKVTNMCQMFYQETGNHFDSFTTLDVSNWNTSNVTNTDNMFCNCNKLTSLDVSKWDVRNLKYMDSMFYFCTSLTALDLSNWDVSNMTNYCDSFIYNCSALTTLIDGHESEPNVVALKGLQKGLDVHLSTKLNYESVYALFRGLATVTTSETITLPSVMKGKLDATKVRIATNKGWTIAYA